MSEHQHQAALFQWAELSLGKYPELELMFAVPNWRVEKKHRIYLAQEGAKKGVPDVWLPVARGGYHGLIIEMKIKPNNPSKDQLSWLENLSKQGYFTAICWSWEDAKYLIEDYLDESYPTGYQDAPRSPELKNPPNYKDIST